MTDMQHKYTTIQEIRARRDQLLKDIKTDSDKMYALKNSLFCKNSDRSGRRMSMNSIINTGTGIFDGLLLVWKLYRKFKK